MKRKLILLIIAVVFSVSGHGLMAQNAAVKTNLASDAATNINLGLEFGLSQKWTLDISGEYNPWTFSDNKKWKHLSIQPEARYWFCQKMMGHFLGFHAMTGKYNIGNIDLDFKMLGTDFRKLKDYRFEGWYVGAGIAYGYAWALGRHWNLEAEIGFGYAYTRYDRYECVTCGKKLDDNKPHHYVGPTKAAINLVYVF